MSGLFSHVGALHQLLAPKDAVEAKVRAPKAETLAVAEKLRKLPVLMNTISPSATSCLAFKIEYHNLETD